MTRSITPHKGGRTCRAPDARMTPQERERLYAVLQRRGVKYINWFIGHVEADYAEINQGDDTMADKITVKQANDVNEPNAYYVTVEDLGETVTYIVNTNERGRGLWIDGKQREGTGQFSVGKRPGEDYRRYFQYITK